ncbi:hypothetical protein WMY93_001868 [Mugilogobius chulae]|uniref:Uncharacterized protein n=1 Tax=Mugilogobius chulae TaxID=88201 RepID=A0AAW0Q1V7_9GOBI
MRFRTETYEVTNCTAPLCSARCRQSCAETGQTRSSAGFITGFCSLGKEHASARQKSSCRFHGLLKDKLIEKPSSPPALKSILFPSGCLSQSLSGKRSVCSLSSDYGSALSGDLGSCSTMTRSHLIAVSGGSKSLVLTLGFPVVLKVSTNLHHKQDNIHNAHPKSLNMSTAVTRPEPVSKCVKQK